MEYGEQPDNVHLYQIYLLCFRATSASSKLCLSRAFYEDMRYKKSKTLEFKSERERQLNLAENNNMFQ